MQSTACRNSALIPGIWSEIDQKFRGITGGNHLVTDLHFSKYSLHQLIIYFCEILRGEVNLRMSTFSISEEVLNSFIIAKEKGLIKGIELICDYNILTKSKPILNLVAGVVDDLYFTSNHTKMALLTRDKLTVGIVTSANLNINKRWENYTVTSNIWFNQALSHNLYEIRNSCSSWKSINS